MPNSVSLPVIEIRGLRKRFCKSLMRSMYYGLLDIAEEFLLYRSDKSKLRKNEFWALSDIDLTIQRGDSIGLIGHNGAGKTTLLKLINGLMKPTSGQITVRGRIGALIALGTGFNPVLTGRENMRISARILGFTAQRIEEKFDEIVAFSDLGDFIDTPVSSYSSGMLARLGFSVAIHLEPEILLVDEVLSVGDLGFTIKCLKKIFEYKNAGGTILLVSHSLYTIRANCSKAIWLENGKIIRTGDVNTVCDEYEFRTSLESENSAEVFNSAELQICAVTYNSNLQLHEDLEIRIAIDATRYISEPILVVSVFTLANQNILTVSGDAKTALEIKQGATSITLRLKNLRLVPGTYVLNIVVAEKEINHQLAAHINKYKFRIVSADNSLYTGILLSTPEWQIKTP